MTALLPYLPLKALHGCLALSTVVFFALRFFWKIRRHPRAGKRWVKIAPHVIDACLLTSGVLLVCITGFYPWTAAGHWLAVKLVLVGVYIALGFASMNPRLSRALRWSCFVLQMAVVPGIVALVVWKNALLN